MLKEQALYNFFSGFGVPAYEEHSVPTGDDRPAYPYITYEMRTDLFGDCDTASTFSIWDNASTWSRLITLVNTISADIGRWGKVLKCNNGYILICRDIPFAQADAEQDTSIKRELCSIKLRYYTND